MTPCMAQIQTSGQDPEDRGGDADRGRHFYICGVGMPVTQLRDLLRGAGYQRRAVQYEKW